jgi:hypothetical protein
MEGKTDTLPGTLATLWENVSALMLWYFGKEELGRFASEVGIGAASMTRIKRQDTAVGVDVIEKIATRFRLQPWQLLASHLGAELHMVEDKRLVAIPTFHPDIAQQLGGTSPRPSLAPAGGAQWRRTRDGVERDAEMAKPATTRRNNGK